MIKDNSNNRDNRHNNNINNNNNNNKPTNINNDTWLITLTNILVAMYRNRSK